MKNPIAREVRTVAVIRYIVAALVLIICIVFCKFVVYILRGSDLQNEVPFLNPSDRLANEDLVGTWRSAYLFWGVDTITLRQDGTFKQFYRDKYVNSGNFVFETSWNPWWLERLSDGRVYLHLKGARYFLDGVSLSEKFSTKSFYFYDWIGDDLVKMTGELILNVRIDEEGNILLVHLWSSSDQGFPLIGGDSQIFKEVNSP
jgi:hypothetical protein